MQKEFVDDLRSLRRTELPNGLTVISEQMPHIRSVSIGIWIRTGSRHESLGSQWHLPFR